MKAMHCLDWVDSWQEDETSVLEQVREEQDGAQGPSLKIRVRWKKQAQG